MSIREHLQSIFEDVLALSAPRNFTISATTISLMQLPQQRHILVQYQVNFLSEQLVSTPVHSAPNQLILVFEPRVDMSVEQCFNGLYMIFAHLSSKVFKVCDSH